jgi:hypothetical protein
MPDWIACADSGVSGSSCRFPGEINCFTICPRDLTAGLTFRASGESEVERRNL